jgi:hypothetical protein
MSLDTQDWTSGKYSFVYSVENLCVTQEFLFNIRLPGFPCCVQGMDRIMETVVKDAHFFVNTELGHHLPVIQLVSFLE